MKNLFMGVTLSLATIGATQAASVSSLRTRAAESGQTIIEIMNSDRAIPANLLDQATCIATFPRIYKAAFIFGAEYGKGFVSCRTANGWSQSVPLHFRAASAGFQFGGRINKVVMIFTGSSAYRQIASLKLRLGVDLNYAAGPITNNSMRVLDVPFNRDVYVYAISNGVMVDASLAGGTIDADNSDTWALYNQAPLTALQTSSSGQDAYLSALDSLVTE